MVVSWRSRVNRYSQRLKIFPFVIAVLVLILMGWVTIALFTYPSDGILFLQAEGEVISVLEDSPADGLLEEGDKILAVDNIPWGFLTPYYPDLKKYAGDTVNFSVKRDGSIIHVALVLGSPEPSHFADQFISILVALCFWVVGVGVGAYHPGRKSGGVAFYWFQASAVTLIAGAASTIGIIWASILFNCMIWLLGPLSVHFHLYFPQTINDARLRTLVVVLYLIAVAGMAPIVFATSLSLTTVMWFNQLLSAGRLFLVLNLMVVVGLLIYGYRYASAPGTRGRVRLVLFGSVLAAGSFLALTLLPDALLQQPLVPFSYAFLFLALVPLTYGYAIFRLNFIEIDRQINRGATYILVYLIMGASYLTLYGLLANLFSLTLAREPLVNTILVLVLASIFFPLQVRVQRFVDKIFYGGWYDYRLGLSLIARGLEQITDLHELGRMISDRLQRTLRLEEAVAFIRDGAGDFSVIEVALARLPESHPRPNFPVLPRSSLTYLLKIGVVERHALMRQLEQITLSPEELQLLKTEQIHLWVPIIGHGQIQGLIALGPKLGGDVFSAEDMDILRMVVQQLGQMIENIHLVTRLKDYAGELEQRVEQRTAELHDAKERVEAILGSVGDGVIVTDLTCCIQRVNTAFEGLSGFASEEVVEKDLFSLFADDSQMPQIEGIRLALAAVHRWSGELTGRRQDGSHYDVQLKLAPVHDRMGQVMSYVGTLTDITRKKELDRMKDMFISDVSHELRTPITNIRLYLDLLDRANPERQKRFLTVVKEQSELLTKLVEDILDLSRLSISRARGPVFNDVDLHKLVDQVITAHMPLAEAHGLNLTCEIDPQTPKVWGEQNQMARLVTNLVANAIRYTPKGAVCVRIYPERGGASLKVEDTGIGIEPQDIPHLYERFYRGKNVRQSDSHGTGLGLAIVKEIVDLHEGLIQVESRMGQGSTFYVWLPAAA